MSDVIYGPRRHPTTRTWAGLGAAVAAVLVMLVLVAAACQNSPAPTDAGAFATAAPTGAGGLGTSDGRDSSGGQSGDDQDGSEPGGGDQDETEQGGEQGTGGEGPAAPGDPQQPGEPAPPPAGPQIAHFGVAQQPQCPGGTDLHPIAGQPVTLEWQVSGADAGEVSLSIDGPGVYNTYPAQGGDTINFPCEGDEGDVQEHTYLLTAVGDGVTVTETLVVSAKVQAVTDT